MFGDDYGEQSIPKYRQFALFVRMEVGVGRGGLAGGCRGGGGGGRKEREADRVRGWRKRE